MGEKWEKEKETDIENKIQQENIKHRTLFSGHTKEQQNHIQSHIRTMTCFSDKGHSNPFFCLPPLLIYLEILVDE